MTTDTATADVEMGATFQRLPVDQLVLVPAPDNPRWDLALTDELIASVAAVGVIQPLVARPHPELAEDDDMWDDIERISDGMAGDQLQRFALAAALCDVEVALARNWARWTSPVVRRHFDFLQAHGYQLTDYEREELAVAEAEALKADVEASARAAVRSCRMCGCTDDFGCDGGCSWVEDDLCSACVQPPLDPAEVTETVVGADHPALADVPEPAAETDPAAVVHTIKVSKSGKKFRVKCSCGDLNALNTTEEYANQAGTAHLDKVGAAEVTA